MALFEPSNKASKAISPDEMESLASGIKKSLLPPGMNLFWKDEEMKKRLGRLEAALLKLKSSPAPQQDNDYLNPDIEKKITWLLEQLKSATTAGGKDISTDSLNRELAAVANQIHESAGQAILTREKYDGFLKLSARLLILLKFFNRSKAKYSFSAEKIIIYRIEKKVKKPILEAYFPKDFKIFSDPAAKKQISDILAILEDLIRFNQHLQSSTLHPAFKSKLEKENHTFNHYHFIFKSLHDNNFQAAFEGKIEGYNNSFMELIPFLHEVAHTGYVIKMISDHLPRSFGFLLYESGGFGDILNTIKTYMGFKEEYPQHEHHLVYNERFVLDKAKRIFPDLNPVHASDIEVDVMYCFLRTDIPRENIRAKLIIRLDEYDAYPNTPSNDIGFHFGFSEKGLGILPQMEYEETRDDVIAYLRERLAFYKEERIPFEESDWALKYFAARDVDFIHENALRQMAFDLERPLILFVVLEKIDRYIEHVERNFEKKFILSGDSGIFKVTGIDNHPLPKPIYLICMESLPHNIFSKLIQFSDWPCIVTGDQSLNEAINYHKPFLYLAASWKRDLLTYLMATLRSLGYADVARVLELYEQKRRTFNNTNPSSFGFEPKNIEPFIGFFHDKKLQARFSEAQGKISVLNISLKYLYQLTLKKWNDMHMGYIK